MIRALARGGARHRRMRAAAAEASRGRPWTLNGPAKPSRRRPRRVGPFGRSTRKLALAERLGGGRSAARAIAAACGGTGICPTGGRRAVRSASFYPCGEPRTERWCCRAYRALEHGRPEAVLEAVAAAGAADSNAVLTACASVPSLPRRATGRPGSGGCKRRGRRPVSPPRPRIAAMVSRGHRSSSAAERGVLAGGVCQQD